MYDRLTPEERFRLVFAASARDDAAERDRICGASPPISLRMPDYAPWSHAFQETMLMVLRELLDEVAKHDDAFERWNDIEDGADDELPEDANDVVPDDDGGDVAPTPDRASATLASGRA